jgi:two-component system, NarL family, sensor histidine kinase DesK
MDSSYHAPNNNKKYPFLPPGHAQRWLSYVWLAYIFWFALEGIARAKSWDAWLVLVLGLALFLPLYFAAFWMEGRRVLWIAAAECLLATVCAPWNPAAAVFFIYAAAALCQLKSVKTAVWSLAAILLWVGLAAAQFQRSPEFWVSGALSVIFVGLVSLWRIQECRTRARLELAQGEVERLAKIAERERIARDLHDLLGHTLSLIVLKSEVASKFADIDPVRAATEIRDVERISREALAQVRAAVRGYHSTGLSAELDHVREALQAAGIELDCKAESIRLAPSHESALVLALREAVTNIVRHSSARSCRIHLAAVAGGIELHISDTGKGSSADEGFGLSGMRERIEAIGGTLEKDGSRGMRLLIRLPTPAIFGAA